MVKKKGLPDFVKSKYDNHFVDEITLRTKTAIIRNIPTIKIIPNILQPRKDFGDITELSKSIKEKGIMEPILVRPKDGQFEIIVGERRFRAAKLAELKEVPCIEYDVPDNEALELSIIENIQRKDLNIYEQAHSLKSLSDIYGYTHQDIAKKIGKSRVTVTELIRITDLPEEIINQCLEMNINSKTFLLELVKLDDIEKMKEILKEFSNKPFSRDKIKEKRKDLISNDKDKTNIKGIKFNFVTKDKAVKIKFDVKDKTMDKNKIIEILEKLISDIKHNKIKEFEL